MSFVLQETHIHIHTRRVCVYTQILPLEYWEGGPKDFLFPPYLLTSLMFLPWAINTLNHSSEFLITLPPTTHNQFLFPQQFVPLPSSSQHLHRTSCTVPGRIGLLWNPQNSLVIQLSHALGLSKVVFCLVLWCQLPSTRLSGREDCTKYKKASGTHSLGSLRGRVLAWSASFPCPWSWTWVGWLYGSFSRGCSVLGNIASSGHPTGGVNKGARPRHRLLLRLTAGSLLAKLTLFCPRPECGPVQHQYSWVYTHAHIHKCDHNHSVGFSWLLAQWMLQRHWSSGTLPPHIWAFWLRTILKTSFLVLWSSPWYQRFHRPLSGICWDPPEGKEAAGDSIWLWGAGKLGKGSQMHGLFYQWGLGVWKGGYTELGSHFRHPSPLLTTLFGSTWPWMEGLRATHQAATSYLKIGPLKELCLFSRPAFQVKEGILSPSLWAKRPWILWHRVQCFLYFLDVHFKSRRCIALLQCQKNWGPQKLHSNHSGEESSGSCHVP